MLVVSLVISLGNITVFMVIVDVKSAASEVGGAVELFGSKRPSAVVNVRGL